MIKEYIIQQTLGKGSYGIVYKVQKKNTNEIYVIKQIPLKDLSPKEINEVRQEAKILSSINSDFVVKYYDSFEENNNINIVMEYCDEGDLNNYILKKKQENKLIEENLIWNIFIKITIGLGHIHKMKILHRDLKTMNIFLKSGFQVKIGDLGVAKILLKNSFAKTLIGTPYYLSPEMCQEKPYNDKSDVWALGCILYELCTFKHPFEAKSQGALILKIMSNQPENINKYYSRELSDLIYLLLEKDIEKRPSCRDILKQDFMMNKAKSLGFNNYLKDLIKEKSVIKHDINSINKVKISTKIININNINNENNNNKQNVFKQNMIKDNPRKIIHNINSNINTNSEPKNIQKKKSNDIKIKEIILGNNANNFINPPISNRNLNNHLLYNNFFINDEKNKYNKKLSNVIISKKKGKLVPQEKPEINSRKIGRINQFKIVLNNPNQPPKTSNNFFPKKILFVKNNDKNFNYKINKEKEDLIANNYINIKKVIPKFIEKDNINEKKQIQNKQINEKDERINGKREVEKKDIIQNFKLEKKKKDIINYNKIVNDEENKNMEKEYLINILDKKDNSNNPFLKQESQNSNMNFEIINNLSKNSQEFENIKKNENEKNDELEDSLDNILVNTPNKKSNHSSINNSDDIYEIENNLSIDNEDENVKEIKEINNQNNKNSVQIQLINKKKELNNEIISLKNKINEIKNDIFNLIGKEDYEFIMELFEKNIKEQNNNEEIYEKIESFSKNKYSSEKKEKFFYYYLLLVYNDNLLDKKNKEIQSLNV